MKLLFVSFYDESSMGLRSVAAHVHAEGHDVHFLHMGPFRYPYVLATDRTRIAEIVAADPFVARDPHPRGDVFIWKSPFAVADVALAVEHVAALAPDAVGMNVIMGMAPVASQLTAALRTRLPETPVVWGGYHPTLTPDDAIQHAPIVCVGDGEVALATWASDPGRTDVAGLWFRRGDKVVRNRPMPPPPLDAIPDPLYAHQEHTLIDGSLSRRTVDDPAIVGAIYTFMAQRGCRYDCAYCQSGRLRRISGRPPADRRSVDRFITEIRSAAHRFRLPPTIFFWDDIFTDDLAWLEEFAPRYAREVGIPFNCQTHPDRCPDRALELLAEAGVAQLAIGLESGSPRVLRDVYGRQPDVGKVVDLAHRAVAAGIDDVQVDLVTNSPFENPADCRETLETLLALPRPYHLEASKLVVYPGTRLASYRGPRPAMTESEHDSWNMLFLMTQHPEVPADRLRAIAADDASMADVDVLRAMAHGVDGGTEPGQEAAERGTKNVAPHRPTKLDVLLVGVGPLPSAGTTTLCSYNLRTAKIAWTLARQGFSLHTCAVDVFPEPGRRTPSALPSLVGGYDLLPEDDHGRAYLERLVAERTPRAIVAISSKAATMVCRMNPGIPLWADMPGWLMSEAQLKAQAAGDDAVLDYYRDQEYTVLRRADKISVVCEAQRAVTLGELGIVGRLSRRNAGFPLLTCIPSLALDWRSLLPAAVVGSHAASIDARVPRGAPVLLWSGSLNLWTDLDWLGDLLGEVMERVPDLHFVATGKRIRGFNDEHCDAFERRLTGAPHRDRCHLLGWLPFASATAWVWRATLGLCVDGDNVEIAHGSRTRLVEMISQGLPAAATTGTELATDLARRGAILPLDPGDRADWGRAIASLIGAPARLAAMAREGRLQVLQAYGVESRCRELVEWLRAPTFAPDNRFATTLGRVSVPHRARLGVPDDALRHSRPMVTWRPQADVEAVARGALSPAFERRSARALKRVLAPLLARRATRLPTLLLWSGISRATRHRRLPKWQAFIDATRPGPVSTGLSERLARDAARRVYARAVVSPNGRGDLKSINALLAGAERDVTGVLAAWPQRIEIEPSSACNIRCRQCQLTHLDAAGTTMAPTIFAKMAPYLRNASIVEFIGRGEPTLNRHLPDFMEAASSAGCWVRMFTNGTHLDTELSAHLVAAGVDEIVLSLLGGDRESYRFITDRDRFDAVVENFLTLRDVKRHFGCDTPRLSICSTLLAGSLDSAPDIVRTAARLGIDTIHFGASYVVMPEMEQESLMNLPRDRVALTFAECRRVAADLGIGIVLPPIEVEAAAAPPMAENRFGCLKPWQSVLVRADGQIEVCSYNRKIVGDLRKQDFPAIWNGAEFAAFRRDEVRHDGINYCDWCYHRAFRGRATSRATHFPYGITFDGYR